MVYPSQAKLAIIRASDPYTTNSINSHYCPALKRQHKCEIYKGPKLNFILLPLLYQQPHNAQGVNPFNLPTQGATQRCTYSGPKRQVCLHRVPAHSSHFLLPYPPLHKLSLPNKCHDSSYLDILASHTQIQESSRVPLHSSPEFFLLHTPPAPFPSPV